MSTCLCEQCFPNAGDFEVLTIVTMQPCAVCGRIDEMRDGGLKTNLFRRDPRQPIDKAPHMSPDHAITPQIIQREMVRLTDTSHLVSKVVVSPPTRNHEGVEIVTIAFTCDDHGVCIACLPIHLLLSVEEFCERVLDPLASCWTSTRPVDVDAIGEPKVIAT